MPHFSGICAVVEGRFIAASHYLSRCGGQCNVYGLMSAFNSGTGSSYSGAASIVNANITMKTWTDFKTLIGYVVVGLIAAVVVSGQCDLLALEDKTARSIGVSVAKAVW